MEVFGHLVKENLGRREAIKAILLNKNEVEALETVSLWDMS